MRLIVSYDIAHPRRLRRVAKIMEDFGDRVQYSVFEMDITPSGLALLQARVGQAMDLSEDGVKYYRLCARCRSLIFAFGPSVDGFAECPFVVL